MTTLKYGDNNEEVRLLQKALNEKAGTRLTTDGGFGKLTETALRTYQSRSNLPVTGLYDAPVQAILAPFIDSKYLRTATVIEEARKLAIPVSMMLSVREVEAKGDGFLPDGRCIILFERHKMFAALTKKRGPDFAKAMTAANPGIVNPDRGGYQGYEREWDRINQARGIDRECADKSASWGMFQIMGFNHEVCGIPTVAEFVRSSEESEIAQFRLFCGFMKSQSGLLTAARQKNYLRFAELYNGSGQQGYDVKLGDADRKFMTRGYTS